MGVWTKFVDNEERKLKNNVGIKEVRFHQLISHEYIRRFVSKYINI